MKGRYIGACLRRREDIRHLLGSARFVDDVQLPHMLEAAILRSAHAHARIVSIEKAPAKEISGVVEVFTAADLAGWDSPIPIRSTKLPGMERYAQHPLARDRVRYVGEPVAVVVAKDRYRAEDGLDAIKVSYEAEAPVVQVSDASKNKVLVHPESGTNLAAVHEISIGEVEEAFAKAEYRRRETFRVHRHTGNPLETRGLVARFDRTKGELTMWGMTKVPHHNRQVIASFLKLLEHRVHFVANDVGGGFGIRGELYPEDFLIPFAAFRLGRPVKWIEDRREHLMAANHSREMLCEVEIAARRDGTLLGLRARIDADMGAYIRTHGALVPCSAAALLTGPYRIPNYQCRVNCLVTNKTGIGTFRAPGRYESCFVRERLLDMVAADLEMDPVDLRLKNLIPTDEMPYEIGLTRPESEPTVLDSGDYPGLLRRAVKEFDYGKLSQLQGQREQGKYHGIGVGYFVKNTGGLAPYEGARVVLGAASSVALYLSIPTLGQGHETIMAQICADTLGVSPKQISVFHGDTDLMPAGNGTFGSRGTVMAGNAVHLAAHGLRKKILTLAAEQLDLDQSKLDLRDGEVYRQDSEPPLLNLEDVFSVARQLGRHQDLEELAFFHSKKLTYVYGVDLCHVTVDPETGQLEICKYLVVEDVGRSINPLLVKGQIVGAAAQGIGATILEDLVYDENGQLLTTTLMDYLLPTSTDVPAIEHITLEEVPSPSNPLGVKGAGEGGIVGTGAALANAVASALRPLGVEVRDLPLSLDKIRSLIRQASGAPSG